MATARFKLEGRYDGTQGATVAIDRQTLLVTVRPSRRRNAFTLRLEDVAQQIIYRSVQAALREKQRAKKAKRGLLR